MKFVKATKKQSKGRAAFIGVSGSGKTWTALLWATVLAGDSGRIAVIDTENGSASKYSDAFNFDTLNLESFTPQSYCEAIHLAEESGYDALIVDSLSHAWSGKDGVLAMVDQATTRARSSNAFTSGWREVTPEHNNLIDALVRCKCHLIVTMRVKTAYEIEDHGGKKVPRKIGLSPVQREGMEYEFDLVADISEQHQFVVSKTRCPSLDQFVGLKPGKDVAQKFKNWLSDGVAVESTDGVLGEIKSAIVAAYPGQSPKDKSYKAALIDLAFGGKSWSDVEKMDATVLRDGLAIIKDTMQDKAAFESQVAA